MPYSAGAAEEARTAARSSSDVTTFGGLAESVAQYLEQGRQVAVAGRIELDEWETDAGERRSRHKVVADEVEFLGGRRSDDDEPGS